MILEQLLEVGEADEIKKSWERQHRFKLKISSFNEVLD